MFLAPRHALRAIALAIASAQGVRIEDTDVGLRIITRSAPPDDLRRALLDAGALPVPVDTATGQQAGGAVHGAG